MTMKTKTIEKAALANSLRELGLTYREIGRRMRCTASNVRQFIAAFEYHKAHPDANGMSLRAETALERIGCGKTKRSIAAAVKPGGRLYSASPTVWRPVWRQYGVRTYRELCAIAGVQPDFDRNGKRTKP